MSTDQCKKETKTMRLMIELDAALATLKKEVALLESNVAMFLQPIPPHGENSAKEKTLEGSPLDSFLTEKRTSISDLIVVVNSLNQRLQ